MKYLLAGLIVFLISSASLGSTYIACDVEATVLEESQVDAAGSLALNVRIDHVQDDHEAHQECELGREMVIHVPGVREDRKISEGDTIILRYTYYSGLGENGLVEEVDWKILSISFGD